MIEQHDCILRLSVVRELWQTRSVYGTLRTLTEQEGKSERRVARILWQNMFRCGIFAVELAEADNVKIAVERELFAALLSFLQKRLPSFKERGRFFKMKSISSQKLPYSFKEWLSFSRKDVSDC